MIQDYESYKSEQKNGNMNSLGTRILRATNVEKNEHVFLRLMSFGDD